jgi:hypothetical protein
MFSAVICARPHPVALGSTLGPLVRGVVEGLVGSAILVTEQVNPLIDELADEAGCRVLVARNWPEGFARLVAQTGGSPLLVVDTGVMLGSEFWPVLADYLPLLGDRPAATGSPATRGMLSRLFAIGQPRLTRDAALMLPGSVARAIAQAKVDPWTFRFGERLVKLPVSTRRVPERS